MKRIVAVMISLVVLLNVSLGYTLTINFNGKVTTAEVAAGESMVIGLASRSEAEYTVNTNNAVLRKQGNLRTFVMPEGNVDISITAKDSTAKTVLDMQVGDYVTYYPTETECNLTELTGIEQDSFNPALTTEWRVLSNDGTTVELVSADSVGSLMLSEKSIRLNDGTFSEGSLEIYETAQANYANVVYILNEISRRYAGDIGTGRGLGYNKVSVEQINREEYELTHMAVGGSADFIAGEPYADAEYLSTRQYTDINALINDNMLHSSGEVWLASRALGLDDVNERTDFGVAFVNEVGEIAGTGLFGEDVAQYAYSNACSYGVRPVIILNSDIEIEAVGNTGDSWKINLSN